MCLILTPLLCLGFRLPPSSNPYSSSPFRHCRSFDDAASSRSRCFGRLSRATICPKWACCLEAISSAFFLLSWILFTLCECCFVGNALTVYPMSSFEGALLGSLLVEADRPKGFLALLLRSIGLLRGVGLVKQSPGSAMMGGIYCWGPDFEIRCF